MEIVAFKAGNADILMLRFNIYHIDGNRPKFLVIDDADEVDSTQTAIPTAEAAAQEVLGSNEEEDSVDRMQCGTNEEEEDG